MRTVVDTLPTPSVTDMGRDKTPDEWDEWTAAMKVRHGNGNGHGASLHVEARRASLPTPTTQPNTGNGHARNLGAETKPGRWGNYAAAVARHEHALGRPAPDPTIPAKRGGRKLSGEFTEWMMMLPHGWIWDLVADGAITNNEALKLCGNGVVTPQAVYALRLMLPHVPRGIVP